MANQVYSFGWSILFCIYASYMESLVHHKILHLGCFPALSKLEQVKHTALHHIRTFRTSHVRMFSSSEHKSSVDSWIEERWPDIKTNNEVQKYGTVIDFNMLMAIWGLMIVPILPLFWLTRGPSACHCMTLLSVPWLSRYVHPLLHKPYEQAVLEAGVWVRPVVNSRYGRWMWKHHWLHHKCPSRNFNLFLFGVGDYLRGVYYSPTKANLDQMKADGGPR